MNLVADSLATATTAGEPPTSPKADDEWHLYEDQLLKAIEASKQEADDARQADMRCEEAELQQAIALSLQLEEERLRMCVIAEAVAQETAAPVAPAPEVELPPTAGFTSAPIAPIYRARPVTADFHNTT